MTRPRNPLRESEAPWLKALATAFENAVPAHVDLRCEDVRRALDALDGDDEVLIRARTLTLLVAELIVQRRRLRQLTRRESRTPPR